MNIGVLCNSKLCIPSVQTLLQRGTKVFLGLPDKVADDHYDIEQFAHHFSISLDKFNKETLDSDLVFWKEQNTIDFIFVITFPHILSAKLLTNIKVDIINFHFAPLPHYKGSQPTFWLIKNGENTGGISVHIINNKVDSGDLIHFEPYALSNKETHNSYLSNVSLLNTKVIHKISDDIAKKSWKKGLKEQDASGSKYYSKPQFKDVRIDWLEMDAEEIERLCRACNPWNKGALAVFQQQAIKLVEVSIIPLSVSEEPPGTIVRMKDTNRLAVSCRNKKYLDINIVYHEQLGFYSNSRLAQLGIEAMMRLL